LPWPSILTLFGQIFQLSGKGAATGKRMARRETEKRQPFEAQGKQGCRTPHGIAAALGEI
jgi:hypothetical protein